MPAQLSTVEAPDMPIIFTIDSEKIESALRKLESHEPLTVFGVQVRAGVRAVLKDKPCKVANRCLIDTADEYRSWLTENDALLNDPGE